MSADVKALRKAIEAKQGPAPLTVVRFSRLVPGEFSPSATGVVPRKRLTYAAIFVEGNWYLTGATTPEGARRAISHSAFTEMLAGRDIRNVELAVEWEFVAA